MTAYLGWGSNVTISITIGGLLILAIIVAVMADRRKPK